MNNNFSHLLLQEQLFDRHPQFVDVYQTLVKYMDNNPNYYRPFCIYVFSEITKDTFGNGFIIPFGLKQYNLVDDKLDNYLFYLRCPHLSSYENFIEINLSNTLWDIHSDFECINCQDTFFSSCRFISYLDVDFPIKIASDFSYFLS